MAQQLSFVLRTALLVTLALCTAVHGKDGASRRLDLVCGAAFPVPHHSRVSRRQHLMYEYQLHQGPTVDSLKDVYQSGDASDRQLGLRMRVGLTAVAPRQGRCTHPVTGALDDTDSPLNASQCAGCLVRLRVERGSGELLQRRLQGDHARGDPSGSATSFAGLKWPFESVGGPTASLDAIISPDDDVCVRGFARAGVKCLVRSGTNTC